MQSGWVCLPLAPKFPPGKTLAPFGVSIEKVLSIYSVEESLLSHRSVRKHLAPETLFPYTQNVSKYSTIETEFFKKGRHQTEWGRESWRQIRFSSGGESGAFREKSVPSRSLERGSAQGDSAFSLSRRAPPRHLRLPCTVSQGLNAGVFEAEPHISAPARSTGARVA